MRLPPALVPKTRVLAHIQGGAPACLSPGGGDSLNRSINVFISDAEPVEVLDPRGAQLLLRPRDTQPVPHLGARR